MIAEGFSTKELYIIEPSPVHNKAEETLFMLLQALVVHGVPEGYPIRTSPSPHPQPFSPQHPTQQQEGSKPTCTILTRKLV